jgi:hypothetical protein
MKKTKKVFLCAITLVIAGLVITSGAVSMVHSEKNTVVSKQISITKMSTSMDMSVSVINSVKSVTQKQMATLSRGTDVLVHHDIDEEDVQNPALVTDATISNVLVFSEYYEGVGQTGMWGRYSMDNGATWSDSVVGFEAIPEDNPDDVSVPKLDYYQDSMAYGTWTAGPILSAEVYYLELPSIVDPEYGSGWTYYMVDWTQSAPFANFDSADVACYPYNAAHSPNAEFWGIVFGTGDRPESSVPAEDHTMWFQYNVAGGSVVLWSFYNMDEDCEKMACDLDISIWQPYMVMQYTMEADPTDSGSLFFKTPKIRPDSYPNDNWVQDGSFTGFYLEDVYTPDIVAAGGSVYIVANTSGGDIVCFYSDNAGGSFEQSIVSEDAGIEAFPQVTMKGSDVICSYTRGGNHYVKVSEDGGVNWGTETQINDEDGTVVEQYGCTGIDGPYASWTDDRAAPPTEIYFDTTVILGDPPGAPTITGPSTGKAGQELTFIFNAVDPNPGDTVKYLIDWGDTVKEETEFKTSGTDVTVKHTWGTQGVYTIIAEAQDNTGLTGPEASKIITIKKSKTLNLPCFRFLQNYPNILPILKYLLGI